mgnify:CR=1 FL=1
MSDAESYMRQVELARSDGFKADGATPPGDMWARAALTNQEESDGPH